MAAHGSSLWMLVLGACLALAVGTDCGKDCALCVYRLLGQQSTLTSLTCSVDCEGGLDSRRLRLCRDVLLEEDLITLDDFKQEPDVSVGTGDDEEVTPEQHQLAKKYGGFMKRYGGFMSRRSSQPAGALEEVAIGNDQGEQEEEDIRMEILKILNGEAEGGPTVEEAVKRYGGFMRRGSDSLEAVLGRGLKKRYGGFMRRVGRPEWLVEDSKSSTGGGVLKRAWEDGAELQKRYGGFMD
ncbi:proenkephalin a [Aplochiton taeniatus]